MSRTDTPRHGAEQARSHDTRHARSPPASSTWATPDCATGSAATGAPVLLLHAGGFGDWFAPVFDEPALDGVRLVRGPPRRATATAPPRTTHLTFADHARQARTLLRELGIDRATWVGHSSSASMALQAAIDTPEAVERLVLLEPAPSPAGPSSEELVRTAVGPARRRRAVRGLPGRRSTRS